MQKYLKALQARFLKDDASWDFGSLEFAGVITWLPLWKTPKPRDFSSPFRKDWL
jgi:hypothetical protein